MKTSGIGGQAVIEGIMMRNKDKYSIAVRKPDKQIELVVKESNLLTEKYKWLNYPIIRGVFNFADSLVTGISTITYSASFYEDEEEQSDTKIDEIGKAVFKDKLEAVLMALTVVVSVIFAVGLFMLLPYFISRLLSEYIVSKFVLNFIEGIVRVIIFLFYILAISQMNDIKRTFMYHGAEHKCINCIENGLRLTPENVMRSSRLHKRCGTSFLFLVMFISIIFFIFIRVENTALQIVVRIILMPVIAGVSYEVIKWAGRSDNIFVNIVSKPGMWLQMLTTKEPDMDMIEVAITAVEAVFDWKAFLKEYYADSQDMDEELEAAERELELSSNLIDNHKDVRIVSAEKLKDISVSAAANVYEAAVTAGNVGAEDILAESDDDNEADEAKDIKPEQENIEKEADDYIVYEDDNEETELSDGKDISEADEEVQDSVLNEDESDAEGHSDSGEEGCDTEADEAEKDKNTENDDGIVFDDLEPLENDISSEDVPVFKQRKYEK